MGLGLLAGFFGGTRPVRAEYPTAKANENLLGEIQGDPDRLVPSSEHFSLAADGLIAYRSVAGVDFFHGINYWLQVRSEARLNPYLTANMRTVLYAGSISYGYAAASGLYNLFGITGVLPYDFAGGALKIRALDLGRQTIGVGMLLQDKEINGLRLEWNHEGTQFLFRIDGTGGFLVQDDLLNVEARFFNGLVGLQTTFWDGEGGGPVRKPAFSFFSTHPHFDLELGYRNGAIGALAALKNRWALGNLQIDARAEARRYGAGFAENITGQMEQPYVTYDQLDKPYTNTVNIFVFGDDVNVFAGHLDLNWRILPKLRLESYNEAGEFIYESPLFPALVAQYYFYRLGLGYTPIPNRDDLLTVYVSNKVTAQDFVFPPYNYRVYNEPIFKRHAYLGLELKFRF